MKRSILTLIAAALFLFVVNGVTGQGLLKIKPTKLTVQGTSSLHDWESEITKAEVKGIFQIENLQLVQVKDVEVKVPVESIKSTKGKLMDSKTYDAFKSEKNPFIIYTLTSVKINAATSVLEAKGNLTMAGVTRPIDLQVKYKVLPTGELQLTLAKSLKMTEFKMVPPTAMMGTIKVGDEVTVNFDMVVNTKLLQ